MPADVVARINAETVKILARPDVKDKLAQEGSEATPGSPQQFAAHIRAEHAKWGALIREANIRIE
jgi:tripartite-type tricarboxylate transporter receptor subunit TctC